MRAQLFRSRQLRDVLEAVRRLPNARQALVERMVRGELGPGSVPKLTIAERQTGTRPQDCPIANPQVTAIRSTIMQVSFARAEFADVKDDIGRHLNSLPGPIDSFLEDHVRDSHHHVATAGDEDAIREKSGDLFGDVRKRIECGELFVTDRAGVSVGFGILAKSLLQRSVASIGMFTLEQFRGAGVGTATIALLLRECARRSTRAVAGCWYYNHPSKRTLERAGMTTKTRLLKLDY